MKSFREIENLNEKKIENIKKIMDESGSDKNTLHNYIPAYVYFLDKFNKNENINFLEIGIACEEKTKSSIHAWKKIFKKSSIYAIDIDPNRMITGENVYTFVADQGSPSDLNKFLKEFDNPKFDVILDDGSHHQSDAETSFSCLFNSLKDDGVYLIEDIRKFPPKQSPTDIQQTVDQWEAFLNKFTTLEWEFIDCFPDAKEFNDSVVLGIWTKK